ncbi:MAG TPA: malate dehydrogenase [Myxococcales bacterium]|jgi:malate dehydrogenase
MLKKIAVIGSGNIGGVLVQEIARRKLARTVAVQDPVPFVNPNDPPDKQEVTRKQSMAKGKALDIAEGGPIVGSDVKVIGSRDYEALADAELIISTAGVPRKARPDGTFPTREELLATNLKITKTVAEAIAKYAPKAIVINIANPLDAIVYTLHKKLSPAKGKLFGMAGVLDSARYRYFVAEAVGVSIENVEATVLGGHGDDMVPVRSCCRIAGLPVEKFLSSEKLDAIEKRTRGAGGEVVGLLGSGSAFVSPAYGALEMAEAIIYDKKKIMAVCAKLDGEYGINDLYFGTPAIVGAGGVEKVIEVDLTEAEKAALAKSATSVRKTFAEVDKMLA